MLAIGCVWFTNTGVFADTHPRNRSNRLCVMFSVFVDGDGHERGHRVILLGLRYKAIATLRRIIPF